jgi:hypothetical protein
MYSSDLVQSTRFPTRKSIKLPRFPSDSTMRMSALAETAPGRDYGEGRIQHGRDQEGGLASNVVAGGWNN